MADLQRVKRPARDNVDAFQELSHYNNFLVMKLKELEEIA